jgi:hypothetical protein
MASRTTGPRHSLRPLRSPPATTTGSVAQDFNVEQSGWYDFNFKGAGDNELDFYINGSITSYLGDPQRPTITGGTQIGTRAGTFTAITTFTGSAYMNAGINTAYMVLWDYGGDTGALIQ